MYIRGIIILPTQTMHFEGQIPKLAMDLLLVSFLQYVINDPCITLGNDHQLASEGVCKKRLTTHLKFNSSPLKSYLPNGKGSSSNHHFSNFGSVLSMTSEVLAASTATVAEPHPRKVLIGQMTGCFHYPLSIETGIISNRNHQCRVSWCW